MTPPAGGDNLVLIGFMGAGKSSVAREITKLTGREFVDTDRIIIQRAGATIPEIFAREGEARFRALENEALESLAGSRQLVIATGGGIVERPENAATLRAMGCVIWLTASDDVLFARVSRNPRRPLLQTADPRATLAEISARRRPLYAACAHRSVDTSERTHAQAAAAVLAAAQDYFDQAAATRPG